MNDWRTKLRNIAWAVAILAGLLESHSNSLAEDNSRERLETFADSELTTLAFIDPDRGWAAGDRGVLWQTEDGGRSWKRQESPANARWESLQFVNARDGWLVGGSVQPYTQLTTAALAQTRDGGKTWKQVSAATLPALKSVRFLDERRGWVAGSPSPLYGTSLFRTEDGGRNWTPIINMPNTEWQTLATDGVRGLVVGRFGAAAFLQTHTAKVAPTVSVGLREPRRLVFSDEQHGWLVGDGGLILQTTDGGATWRASPGLPSADLLREFDFSDICTVGKNCWVVGAPGSCVWHSPDSGQSWTSHRTGQSLPLRAVTFLDEQRGWAAGALGTILATRDGGKTWIRQLGGGRRMAVLGVFSEAEQVPWELFAQLCGNDGYLGALELLNRRDVEFRVPRDAHDEARGRAAFSQVGGSACGLAHDFPLRQAGLPVSESAILEGWRDSADTDSLLKLENHVVKIIRQWRPEVILTEEVQRVSSDPVAQLVQQAVTRATQRAALPDATESALAFLALEPWKARKVLAIAPGEQAGSIQINTSQLAPRLAKSLADAAAPSRALVGEKYEVAPTAYSGRVLANHVAQELGRRDLMSGIVLPPGGDARRPQETKTAGDMRELNRAAQQQRTVQLLMARTVKDGSSGTEWLAQIDDLVRGLKKDSAADLLFQLAHRYYEAGKSELALETLSVVAERYADQHVSGAALAWLVQMYASGEVALRSLETTRQSSQVVAAVDSSSNDATVPKVKLTSNPTDSLPAVARSAPRDLQVLSLAKKLERAQPMLFARPETRFAIAGVQRRAGQVRDAETFFRSLASGRSNEAWSLCANTELSLAGGKTPLKPTYVCEAAKTKPRLDGKLDDDVWKQAKKMDLRSALADDAEWPAATMLAYDDEFLYLAIQCHKAAGTTYPPSDTSRPRDPDLQARDRVELLLDVDRDYTSFFRLTVDHRGWAADACFGDKTWNPTWYIAAQESDISWNVEAAIPWKELTRTPRTSDTIWAMGMQRVIPGVGFQSWTQPAAVRTMPSGFGLLMWE